MGYVAIKGGEKAIKHAISFYDKFLDFFENEGIDKKNFFVIQEILSESSLYSTNVTTNIFHKIGGDKFASSFFMRSFRSSCNNINGKRAIDVNKLRIIRKISSAFKNVPGGQILGPSLDYLVKVVGTLESVDNFNIESFPDTDIISDSILESFREKNLVKTLPKEEDPFDITKIFPEPPYKRSAVLQMMARGETGSLLAFAYTSMRGYGDVHPTIGDLRVGFAEIYLEHPFIGEEVKVCEILLTSCEILSKFEKQEDGRVKLTSGFGACFGFNETKAISMAIIDSALYNSSYTNNSQDIASNFDIIMNHIDSIESVGFANHYKLPHYVTFLSDLKVFENVLKGGN